MHEVVVMAVRKAVSAATTTFTAISMNRFFITFFYLFLALLAVLRRAKLGVPFLPFYPFTFLPFAYPCAAVCSVIQSSSGVTFLM